MRFLGLFSFDISLFPEKCIWTSVGSSMSSPGVGSCALIFLLLCCSVDQCKSTYEEQGLCFLTDLRQAPRYKNLLTLFANAKAVLQKLKPSALSSIRSPHFMY